MSYATFAEKYISRAYPEAKKKSPVVSSDGRLSQKFVYTGPSNNPQNRYYLRFVAGDPTRVQWVNCANGTQFSIRSLPFADFTPENRIA